MDDVDLYVFVHLSIRTLLSQENGIAPFYPERGKKQVGVSFWKRES